MFTWMLFSQILKDAQVTKWLNLLESTMKNVFYSFSKIQVPLKQIILILNRKYLHLVSHSFVFRKRYLKEQIQQKILTLEFNVCQCADNELLQSLEDKICWECTARHPTTFYSWNLYS